jgi:hypothetical protein
VAQVGQDVVSVSLRAFELGVPPFLDVPLGERIEVTLAKRLPDDASLAGGAIAGHRAIPVFVFGDVEVAASGDGSPLEIALPVECFLEDGFRIPQLPAQLKERLLFCGDPMHPPNFTALQLPFDLLRQLFSPRLGFPVLDLSGHSGRSPCRAPWLSRSRRRVEFHRANFRVEGHGGSLPEHTENTRIFCQYDTFKNGHKKPVTN